VFYLPFWQTGVGGSALIDGVMIYGAQNIFFAELASPNTVRFSVEATRFMSGKFPLMIFGLPGAALAMYTCARNEKKKVAGGLLLSAALTAMITGITEPLEFTFLFVAPALYLIHSILAGLAYMLMYALGVGVGMTFSGGIIDLTLFGIIQGNAKTNWLMVPLVGIFYFAIYFFLFRFLIRKMNYMTPGREDDLSETKLYTRADYNAKKAEERGTRSPEPSHGVSMMILDGLGGKDNILNLDCCATRLRVTVKDPDAVKEALLKQSGAAGVIRKGGGVQVIYGPQVSVIKSELEEYIASI
jgi:PTS system D-glucosamine-specific IIC component